MEDKTPPGSHEKASRRDNRRMCMKKLGAAFLAVLLLLSLTACGEKAEIAEATPETSAAEPSVTAESRVEETLEQTAQWLMTEVPEPGYGSIAGEWLAFGLARWEHEELEDYLQAYAERVAAYTAEQAGVLHNRKYTEYSRVILAWTAVGRDARNVGGFDLLMPLADFDKTVFQGINGPIFALLALDSGQYDIPQLEEVGIQATREKYVEYLLGAQQETGGWSFSGGAAETDITAMALQALAKYQDRQDVAQAVEQGLTVLSELQNPEGGYGEGENCSSESIAQVMVALTELGLPLEDARFVKNGKTLLDALLAFQLEDGSFCHMPEGESDLMATEQAFYALVALERMEQGKTSLYSVR